MLRLHLLRLLRASFLYAIAAGGASAFVLSFARALCLPPYWPAEYVLRCRGGEVLRPLLGAVGGTLMTTLLLLPPALAAGGGVFLLVRVAEQTALRRRAPLVGGAAAALAWIWLLPRLETSYLDFLVWWDAVLLGAAAAALVGARVMPAAGRPAARAPGRPAAS